MDGHFSYFDLTPPSNALGRTSPLQANNPEEPITSDFDKSIR